MIAGAGGDIGVAMARAFADERARVLAASRTPTQFDPARDITGVQVDLATEEGPGGLLRHAEQTHGSVDVLINNVGPIDLHDDGFLSVEDADFRDVLERNLLVAARTCRAALPGMVARHSGSIVNLASVAARRPVTSLTHYSAAKAALVNLTAVWPRSSARAACASTPSHRPR